MSRAIRVSEAAYTRLVAMAKSESRTVIAVVDRLVGVTAGMVEPVLGSDTVAETSRRLKPQAGTDPSGGSDQADETEETIAARKARLQANIDAIQTRDRHARQRAANAREWRGREGEDDQRPPEEWDQ